MNTNKRTLTRFQGHNWRTFRLRFGKHQGVTLAELVERDPDYLAWLAGTELHDGLTRACIDQAVMAVAKRNARTTDDRRDRRRASSRSGSRRSGPSGSRRES